MSDVTCTTCEGEGVVDVNTCPQDGIGSHYDCYHDCLTCKGTGTAAAPAVDGWVWCEASAWEHIPGEPINLDSFAPCRNGDCPGPHRTLLLGPEVTS